MRSNTPITVDLFSGAGGMTEGFKQAGYSCAMAIESDEMAAKTFAWNHPTVPLIKRDIRKVTNSEISEALHGISVDVVSGGPPCQSFSLAGPRLSDDPRNFLFHEFVRVVNLINPQFFVFENVVGLASMQSGAILSAILAEFSRIGYSCNYKILNAAEYGVPQARPRLIILGSQQRDELPFPSKTHSSNPAQRSLFDPSHTLPFVTVWEALSNLPHIRDGEGEEEGTHPGVFHNNYQRALSGQREPGILYNHRATRHSELIRSRYASIREGGDSRDIPPELQTKKGNIYRLGRTQVSRTVTCNHRTDLLHPTIPRGTTVREVARLQSFDDDYRFFGNLTRKARWVTQDDQVGNAVPPFLARAVAKAISGRILLKSSTAGVVYAAR
jgi:DNA (cytosine-5)-methyltransferase 1